MSAIILNVFIHNIPKKVSYKTSTDRSVFDICQAIQNSYKNAGQGHDFGLFVSDQDPKQSFWLETSRLLSYYHLYDGMEVEYKSKLRRLIISTMDGTRKTLQVDDSKSIADLMPTICGKMGITNHEEYSLIHEKARMQTIRKLKNPPRDHDKMEKLKQKLQTDDDLNWLSHSKTLRQHGIEETDIILLQRKYFFSDQNVDARDPVQLNLLFLQLKTAILNGAHPISLEQAIELAGLQSQAEVGNMNAEKLKTTSIDLKEHLPKEYVKTKGIEKRIKETHQTLNGLSENDAKIRYIQLCRSLPTYGITFFIIKEKLTGRNKLVPRLFGVSKESVMRVDEKTKEIIETWPLTRVHRWAATAHLFTLDFGEYSPDGNYVMQTSEGEHIAQLISGYIDIILRRKKKSDITSSDANDSNVIFEENVGPSRAEVVSSVGTSQRGHMVAGGYMTYDGHVGHAGSTFNQGTIPGGGVGSESISNRYLGTLGTPMRAQASDQYAVGGAKRKDGSEVQMVSLRQPKRAVMSRIDSNTKGIQFATDSLQKPYFEDVDTVARDDLATQRWRAENMTQARAGISSHLGAMTIATGNLLAVLYPLQSLNDEDESQPELDYGTVDASLTTIGLNVQRLMQNVRMLDQLQAADLGAGVSQSPSHIALAAQDVAAAFIHLMETAMPANEERSDEEMQVLDRPSLYEAASKVGDASQQLLQLVSTSQLHSHRRLRQILEAIPEDEEEDAYGAVGTGDDDYETENGSFIETAHAHDWQLRDDLLSATKEVANATANLVKFAKTAAVSLSQQASNLLNTETDSPTMADERDRYLDFLGDVQSQLIKAATQAGKATSRLVTCAKVVVCTMEQPASQRQMFGCVKQVSQAVNGLADVAAAVANTSSTQLHTREQRIEQAQVLDGLGQATNNVNAALEQLTKRLMAGSVQAQQDQIVCNLLEAANHVPASLGDGEALLRESEALVHTTSCLIGELRSNHELLSAANISEAETALRASLLTSATSELIEAMKALASGNQQSLPLQQEVVARSNSLIAKAQSLAAPLIRSRLATGLEFATRLTATNASLLTTVTEEAVRASRTSQYKILKELDTLQNEVMPEVNISCDQARAQPLEVRNQTSLLAASKNLMDCLKDFLGSVDILAPTVTDTGIQAALTSAAQSTQTCLTDLRQCCATAEPVLTNSPPSLPDFEAAVSEQKKNIFQPGVPARLVWPSIASKLVELQTELDSNSDHRLPGETLDSVCSQLINAIGRFNEAFPGGSASQPSSLPEHLMLEAKEISTGSGAIKHTQERIPPVSAKLLDYLESVVQGVRGVAGYLSSVKDADVEDKALANVLILSWQLTSAEETLQQTKSVRPSSQVFNAELAATELKKSVIRSGQKCLDFAHSSLLWALHDTQSSEFNTVDAIGENAIKLVASVNDLRKFVPGQQIISKLNSVVDELPGGESVCQTLNGSAKSQPNIRDTSSYSEPVDSDALFKALHDLIQVSEDTGLLASDQSAFRRNDQGTSSTCSLAMAADRLANALYQVLDVFKTASSDGTGNNDLLLNDLQKAARPLAMELQRALCGEGGIPSNVQGFNPVCISKACFQLRDWAVNAAEQTQGRLHKHRTHTSEIETPGAMEMELQSVRARLASALEAYSTRKAAETIKDSSTPSPAQFIGYPVSKLTYPQCVLEVDRLEKNLMQHVETIPLASRGKDAKSFCAAVQGVADAALGMLQVATQSAYLVGAGQPCNAPGRAPRLTQADAKHLVDVTDVMCTDLDELISQAYTLNNQTVGNDHAAKVVNAIIMNSSQVCQLARQCISESTIANEKKIFAEEAKSVAQTTTHLVNAIHPQDHQTISGDQVSHLAANLKRQTCKLSDSLCQNGNDSPIQVLREAAPYQAPILQNAYSVVNKADELSETAGLLIDGSGSDSEVESAFRQRQHALQVAATDLLNGIQQHKPGLSSLESLRSSARSLLRQLNDIGVSGRTNGDSGALASSGLEKSVPLINSSLQQIAALSGKMAGDWRQIRWELVGNDANQIISYLPSLFNECIAANRGLNRSSDQAQIQEHLRTVLEAVDVLAQHVIVKMTSVPKIEDATESISKQTDQLRLACRDLLASIDELSSRQDSLNSQTTSIQNACAKLNDSSRSPTIQDQNQFGTLQTRLINQVRGLRQVAGRLSEAVKVAASGISGVQETEEAAATTLVKEFSKAVETTKSFAGLLSRQHCDDEFGELKSRVHLAEKLRLEMQGIGNSCVHLLYNPINSEVMNKLTSRVTNLVAMLQESARGVHACAGAAEGISNVIAEFDSAICFTRANSLFDSAVSQLGAQTAIPSGSEIQNAQEEVMHLAKGIIEETNALSQNQSVEQDSLAVSAQNCLLHVRQLHQTTLRLVSQRPTTGDGINAGEPVEAKTEARVNLLAAARAVSTSLIDLLSQSRALASAGIDNADVLNGNAATVPVMDSSSIKKQLSNTAKEVVTRIAELRVALRYFNEVVCPIKSPSPVATTPLLKPSEVIGGVRVQLSSQRPLSTAEEAPTDSATASVRAGLQTVLATINKLNSHLDGWSPQNGTFREGDDLEREREITSGKMTTPAQINQAALGITQAALKANSATTSARKLTDLSLAGEVIHQAATELVKRLRCGTQAAISVSSGESSADGTDDNHRLVCEKACLRVIEGGKATLSELAIMLQHMIGALEDKPTGQSPSMQVTLAMRRLRETVFEIVEGSKQMPGESDTGELAQTSRGQPIVLPRPISQISSNTTSVSHGNTEQSDRLLSTPDQLAQSIARAEEIATDVGDIAGTQELKGFTSEIEISVQKLIQLQTRAAVKTTGMNGHAPKTLGSQQQQQRTQQPHQKTVASELEVLDEVEITGEGVDAILAACRKLAHAAAILMHWTAAVQRELVQQGRLAPVSEVPLDNAAESQWTCGLVSAARLVSAATNHLVESAQTLVAVRGGSNDPNVFQPTPIDSNPEALSCAPVGLIGAARTAVSYTSQLVFACIAKADPNSRSMCGVNSAASALRRHAERVVALCQTMSTTDQSPSDSKGVTSIAYATGANQRAGDDGESYGPKPNTVLTMRQVIETKSSIAHKMAELERLQNRLKSINQESYRHQTDENDF